MIYEQLTLDCLPSMESDNRQSSPQGSLVSLTALQEKVVAIVTSVTCGGKLRECSEKLNRVGLSVKIRPVYLQEAISGFSAECSTTLPRWGIRSAGGYGALVTSEHRTDEKEYSLLPTPTATDGVAYMMISKKDVQKTIYRQHHSKMFGRKYQHTKRLVEYMAYFGTPLNRICELYETIMGFPKGWTGCDASETR